MANFRIDEQVESVLENHEHHNIGIGHGNVQAFDSMIQNIRLVDSEEL
jgi:hypothetical protein